MGIFNILKNEENLVNTKELVEGFKWLKIDRQEEDIFKIAEKVAEEGEFVDEDMFLQIISELTGHKFNDEGREALFTTVCKSDKEQIDLEDIKELAKLNGDNIATAELEEMIQQSTNHQDAIGKDNFKLLMSRKTIG